MEFSVLFFNKIYFFNNNKYVKSIAATSLFFTQFSFHILTLAKLIYTFHSFSCNASKNFNTVTLMIYYDCFRTLLALFAAKGNNKKQHKGTLLTPSANMGRSQAVDKLSNFTPVKYSQELIKLCTHNTSLNQLKAGN